MHRPPFQRGLKARLTGFLLVLDGGVLDHPVSSLADALVAAHGRDVGVGLDLVQRLFGALCTFGQSLFDLFLGGQQVLLLCDLQQSHVHAGGLFGRRTDLGGKALAGLVDLAQVAVQTQALHLQLLLDLLHLLLVSGLHQYAGQFALGSIGQLGQDLRAGIWRTQTSISLTLNTTGLPARSFAW